MWHQWLGAIAIQCGSHLQSQLHNKSIVSHSTVHLLMADVNIHVIAFTSCSTAASCGYSWSKSIKRAKGVLLAQIEDI